MADPEITGQLITGFYPIEENSWRWVKRSFSVGLKPPENARRNGGRLTVHLYLPMEEIRDAGAVTLSASVDGKSIGRQVFAEAGRFDFVQDLSAEDLDTNILPVQFRFDKSIPPGLGEKRELAGVITGISLVARGER